MKFCEEYGVECIEKVSHTLWSPKDIIRENGGTPPLTFKKFQVRTCTSLFSSNSNLSVIFDNILLLIFQAIANNIGEPQQPVSCVDWLCVNFKELPISVLGEFKVI